MATLPCDTSVTDRMPALAITDAVNDLDTLTLFAAAQTGGPAASPVEQRIWILHDWMRRSVPPMPPLPGTPRGPPTWRQRRGPDCATGPVLDGRWPTEPQSISHRSPVTGASVAHSSAPSALRKMDWLANSPKEAKHAVKSLCTTWLLICKV